MIVDDHIDNDAFQIEVTFHQKKMCNITKWYLKWWKVIWEDSKQECIQMIDKKKTNKNETILHKDVNKIDEGWNKKQNITMKEEVHCWQQWKKNQNTLERNMWIGWYENSKSVQHISIEDELNLLKKFRIKIKKYVQVVKSIKKK
jgi:hypothetical protein